MTMQAQSDRSEAALKDVMTAQEVFDHVVAHLRKQGCRATDGVVCRYRGNSGTACAAGCLMRDDEYSPVFENTRIDALLLETASISHVSLATPAPLKTRLAPHQYLVQDLQSCHDSVEVRDWESELRHIADKYKLQYSAKQEGQ